jgi:3-oxoacyl-[acyl-carrier protein] reductase
MAVTPPGESMDIGLKGKKALVTGASRGIGRGIARVLAQEGAELILVARDEARLEEAKKNLPGAGNHSALALDLMKPDHLQKLVGFMETRGSPEILVHNLGGSLGVTDPFASAEEWSKVWHFNLGIGHEINRKIVPLMASKKWGRIIHVSTLATQTHEGNPAYIAAKCALNGYVKCLAREVARHNIVVAAVSPGIIRIEGRYFANLEKEKPEEFSAYLKNHLPMMRLGEVGEVANVVAFLCSEKASFMTGSNVSVDGGGR